MGALMMTPLHYAVLWLVYVEQQLRRSVSAPVIRIHLMDQWPALRRDGVLGRVLGELTDPGWHEHGPLLQYQRSGYQVRGQDDGETDQQRGGYLVLAEARSKPHLDEDARRWIDEQRYPSEVLPWCNYERTKAREIVAVPTGSTVHGRQPRDNDQGLLGMLAATLNCEIDELPELVKRNDLRFCPRCNAQGRQPFRPMGEFGERTRGGLRGWCRRCEADADAERRAQKETTR